MRPEPVHTPVSYEELPLAIGVPAEPTIGRPARSFAGLSIPQIVVGSLVLVALIWAMWTTREVLALRHRTVVSVRLGELVNRFALAEARSGDEPGKVEARTRAYMVTLDKVLKEHSSAGEVVLVGEAVVSASMPDITAAVAADVAQEVPMPVALPLPPRASVPAMAALPLAASPAPVGLDGTVLQASPFGARALQSEQGGVDPSAQGPDNGQQ